MRLRALCLTRLRKRKKPVIFIQIAGARPSFSAHDSRSRHKPESTPRHSAILENPRPASGFLKWNSALFLCTVRSVQSTTEPPHPVGVRTFRHKGEHHAKTRIPEGRSRRARRLRLSIGRRRLGEMARNRRNSMGRNLGHRHRGLGHCLNLSGQRSPRPGAKPGSLIGTDDSQRRSKNRRTKNTYHYLYLMRISY